MEHVNPRGSNRIGICPECRKVFRIFPEDWESDEAHQGRTYVKCLVDGCPGIIDKRENSRIEGT